jgi:hypothetical protein
MRGGIGGSREFGRTPKDCHKCAAWSGSLGFHFIVFRKRASSKLWIVLPEFIAACNFSPIFRFEANDLFQHVRNARN